jgi:CRISPR-associated endonuclease/helicase Cas3
MQELRSHLAWAKLEASGSAALPLADHGADVASVFKALIETTLWAGRIEYVAGRGLTAQDRARLCAFAYLHDLGKANRGFWRRQFEGARIVGHTNETAALFYGAAARSEPGRKLAAIIHDWDAWELFAAVMAHHGRPLPVYHRDSTGDAEKAALPDKRFWQAEADYDPIAELGRLLDLVEARFPPAFAPGPPMPDAPALVALTGGLVTLADWLGSDTGLFPVAGPHGDAREAMRASGTDRAVIGRGLTPIDTPPVAFGKAFGIDGLPRPIQAAADRLDLGPIALIEAETGSGKTEAALWRWLALRRAGDVDGLYFALPTRSAAVQLHGRVQRMLDQVFGLGAVEAVLAVPGYLKSGDAEGQALPGFEVTWPDEGAGRDDRWAAESPKRYLTARVAIGTIDQALMAGLKLRHAHFRAAALARSLLVVDEVHASDEFMGEALRHVLRNHVALGGQALLLSATLGAEARTKLLDLTGLTLPPPLAEAETTPYPALWGSQSGLIAIPGSEREKQVTIEPAPVIDHPDAIAALAVAAARAGASVLVVRNSVRGAIDVAQAVEALAPELAFRVNSIATLHHGRFASEDRRLLDEAVEVVLGKGRSAEGRILVGTQTLEQSLDIDADLILTDLAPIDVLLQRIGRLHRHPREDRGAFGEARAIVLVPDDRDLARYLGRVAERHGLGPIKDGQGVYRNLLHLEATWRVLEENPQLRIPADNRRLVERALHPDVSDALKAKLGTAWINHGNQQEGMAISERGLARDFALDVGAAFTSLLFPPQDEAVSTRLGTRDRLVRFDPPLPGPFGTPISQIRIPGWMASGIGAEVEPTEIAEDDEGVIFRLGERIFRYGRFGLEAVTRDS